MTMLTLNPHIEIVPRRVGTEIVAVTVGAPIRGRPLTRVTFTREQEPEAVELLMRLTTGRAVETLVDDALWDRLVEIGVLVAEDRISHLPRFVCPLPPPLAAPPALLSVIPSLRYRDDIGAPPEGIAHRQRLVPSAEKVPFNAFSDACAWAFVEHPDAAAPSPLSVAPADRPVFRQLCPGKPAPDHLTDEIRGALAAADVLAPPESLARRREAWIAARNEAVAHFRAEGYAPFHGFLHPLLLAALRDYFRALVREGHVRLDDADAPRRLAAHNEPVATYVHRALAPLVSEFVGEPMSPAYVFFASYLNSATLDPHRDRAQCAVSISLLLDYTPEPSGPSPWPLWLESRDGRAVAIHQSLGEGLVYRGTELSHWRHALPEGHTSTSLFLHYVPAAFQGSLD